MPVNIAAAGGSGGGGIFSLIADKVKKNIGEVQAKVQSSLNVASNLGLDIKPALPSIDPNIQTAINQTFSNELPKLAESIIDTSGLKDLIKEIQGVKKSETEKAPPSDEQSDRKSSTPTQASNKPVQKAEQSREEGRSQVEQIFLDMLNGKIDFNLGR